MGSLNDKLEKFQLALHNLEEALAEPIKNNRDRAGIIQTFEFTYEMAWKLLRDILIFQGTEAPSSPRAIFKEAYASKLINEDSVWLSMISKRNLTTHNYDQNTADQVIAFISKDYLKHFRLLNETAQKSSK